MTQRVVVDARKPLPHAGLLTPARAQYPCVNRAESCLINRRLLRDFWDYSRDGPVTPHSGGSELVRSVPLGGVPVLSGLGALPRREV